jgi:anti-sigma B factor antagonist
MRAKQRSSRIVSLVGEFDLSSKDQLWESLSEAIPYDVAIVDLTGVSYIDSTGLSCFVILRKRIAEHGGIVALVNPPATILKLLQVCGFDKIFPIYDSLATATKELLGRKGRRMSNVNVNL